MLALNYVPIPRCFVMLLTTALALPSLASASPVLDLTVQGEDWVCQSRLLVSHSVEIALDPSGCHGGITQGSYVRWNLYRWADNRFLPVTLPRPVRSISADARYAVSGESEMSGLESQVLLHDLQLSATTLIAVGGFVPLLTADGSAVIYGDTFGYRILRWDRATGTTTQLTAITAHLSAASADGSVLAVHGDGRSLRGHAIFDVGNGNVEMLCLDPYDAQCFLGLSPDGRWIVYRATLADGSRERRLRDRSSGVETVLPGADQYAPLRVVFDQASQRMLFSQQWPGCGDSLFVRDLTTHEDKPVVIRGGCPARGTPSAFGPGFLAAVSGTYVVDLGVIFSDGVESDVRRLDL